MKTVIIVQARMTSTRLPGKVLKPVLGTPLLAYQIDRLRRVRQADEVVIATTANHTDEPIVALCERMAVPYVRGSETDVLARYHVAAQEHRAAHVVRVTSDCPLIDPAVIDQVIAYYHQEPGRFDYVSNVLPRSFPRGMDTEVFSFAALDEAHNEAVAEPDREHVTPFINRNPARYRLGNLAYSTDASRHRWTVDTDEDLALITRILEALYPGRPEFTLEDCLELLQRNPEWELLNAHVEQKCYGQ